ncbi:uncharacterized protein LOC142976102 isoform X2 [Anticarsia gemmatalis]|uniref:uncharacterized protein LOC142976102 isoform X2 n=1 Tax=Anticarsia gemmatalis TaxID=129554 RepID=UPI003F75771F
MKTKQASHTILYDSKDLNMDEDYERVHNTLQDAKKFSMYLMGVLQTYEKANKEFVKITDELKLSFESICAHDISGKRETSKMNIININNKPTDNPPETPCLTETASSLPYYSDIELNTSGNTILQSAANYNFFSTDVDHILNKKLPTETSAKHEVQNILKTVNQNNATVRLHGKVYNPKDNLETTNVNELNDTQTSIESSNKDAPLKPTITIAARAGVNTKVSNFSSTTGSTVYLSDVSKDEDRSIPSKQRTANRIYSKPNQIMKTLDSGFESNDTSIVLSTHKGKNGDINKGQQWPLKKLPEKDGFKKYIKSKRLQGKESLNAKSKLELEIKEPLKLHKKSGRTTYIDKEVSCKNIPIPDDVEKHLRDIMNDTAAQSSIEYIKNENTIHRNNTSSSSRVCEGQKVKFLVVRKVSDHTVLIKWSQPRERTQIQGYELLVDGRAAQTIFSPSKCMAVVTCLPHNDKILLTIRTITSALEAGRYPASTIIYRPRVK